MTPKWPIARDGKYLDFIRTRPCSFCACQVVEPHHVLKGLRGIRAGMVQKIDYVAIPLCRRCHEDLHKGLLKPSREELLEVILINVICYLDQRNSVL